MVQNSLLEKPKLFYAGFVRPPAACMDMNSMAATTLLSTHETGIHEALW